MKKMIALRSSTSDGSSFRVYDDDILIGHINRQRALTGDRYLASIDWNGKEKSNDKAFDSPGDALKWIENQR
jgi:hypothetical protein